MEKHGQREQKNEMQNPRRWLAGMQEEQVIPESAPNPGPTADARSHHPPWMVLSLNLTEAALLGSLRSEAQDTGLGGQLWDPAPLLPLPWCLLVPPMSTAAIYLTLAMN